MLLWILFSMLLFRVSSLIKSFRCRNPFIRKASATRFSSFISSLELNAPNVTVQAICQQSLKELSALNISEPEESVVHLMSKSLGLPYETGFRQIREVLQGIPSSLTTRALTSRELEGYLILLKRRMQHEPIQYIIGKWDFLDHTLQIQPPLLCPRPETEELVLLVEDYIRNHFPHNSTLHILDVGAGTGCIGIALAHRLPNIVVTALDIEPTAVATSSANAESILRRNWSNRYHPLLTSVRDYSPLTKLSLIVSNPPYIPRKDMQSLDSNVLEYESHEALCGGDDGLDVIRVIIDRIPHWCTEGATCWMEVDPSHPAMLQNLLESNPNILYEATLRDMYGFDRFVRLKYTSAKDSSLKRKLE